jgi:hypothetical protein
MDRVHSAVDRWCARVHGGPGWRGHLARRCLTGARHASARTHRSSPAVAEEDERDEVVPEGCSSEQERR